MSDTPNDAADTKADAEYKAKADAWMKVQISEADRLKEEHEARQAKAKTRAAAVAAAAEGIAKRAADDLEARRIASHGGQITLDPESDAALAARGALGTSIHDNTVAMQEALIDMGFDPLSPSAHLTDKPPAAPAAPPAAPPAAQPSPQPAHDAALAQPAVQQGQSGAQQSQQTGQAQINPQKPQESQQQLQNVPKADQQPQQEPPHSPPMGKGPPPAREA